MNIKKLLLFFCVVFSLKNYSQSIDPVESVKDSIYSAVRIDKQPEFPGGIDEFYKYVMKEYKMPKAEGLYGKVFTLFVVEKDGSIGDIKVLKDEGFGTREEAIRVLQNCPKWTAAEMKGEKVRVQLALPIAIKGVGGNSFDDWQTTEKTQKAGAVAVHIDGVDVKPEFPGGINEFYRFITRNFMPPDNEKFPGGKVYVNFIIGLEGNLEDIKVLRDAGFGTGKEIIRVLSRCPKWKPAIKDGQNVKVIFSLPISIPKTVVEDYSPFSNPTLGRYR